MNSLGVKSIIFVPLYWESHFMSTELFFKQQVDEGWVWYKINVYF